MNFIKFNSSRKISRNLCIFPNSETTWTELQLVDPGTTWWCLLPYYFFPQDYSIIQGLDIQAVNIFPKRFKSKSKKGKKYWALGPHRIKLTRIERWQIYHILLKMHYGKDNPNLCYCFCSIRDLFKWKCPEESHLRIWICLKNYSRILFYFLFIYIKLHWIRFE